MTTFIKTFLICLAITIAFLSYKFVSHDSYSPDLSVSEKNPVFVHDKTYDKVKAPVKPPEEIQEKQKYIIYFYTTDGKLTPSEREMPGKFDLNSLVNLLLKGPTISETNQGIYSEIPKNVDLISTKTTKDYIIVNLTSAFGDGGGSSSIEARVKQLSKTLKSNSDIKTIYLYIDNQQVEYLGGEGVFIKQPLD
ncbi:GerMN domain-containing protein [bacterium]|nr:GerMN domain-containing protein [bacterium]